MKVNNIFSVLFVALSLLAFSCNHTPSVKKKDNKAIEDENKGKGNKVEIRSSRIVKELKEDLEEVDSDLGKAKAIEIKSDMFDSNKKLLKDKVGDVQDLYKGTKFQDIVIEERLTKEDIHKLLDEEANILKEDLILSAVGNLLDIIDEEEKVKTLLIKEIASIKGILEEILVAEKK